MKNKPQGFLLEVCGSAGSLARIVLPIMTGFVATYFNDAVFGVLAALLGAAADRVPRRSRRSPRSTGRHPRRRLLARPARTRRSAVLDIDSSVFHVASASRGFGCLGSRRARQATCLNGTAAGNTYPAATAATSLFVRLCYRILLSLLNSSLVAREAVILTLSRGHHSKGKKCASTTTRASGTVPDDPSLAWGPPADARWPLAVAGVLFEGGHEGVRDAAHSSGVWAAVWNFVIYGHVGSLYHSSVITSARGRAYLAARRPHFAATEVLPTVRRLAQRTRPRTPLRATRPSPWVPSSRRGYRRRAAVVVVLAAAVAAPLPELRAAR